MSIFISIRELISLHDIDLRASEEIYTAVRHCFDQLYEFVGGGVKTEWSYHAEEGTNNWELRLYENYEPLLQTVKIEFESACEAFHNLRTSRLQYNTYCAFMQTYRMCMNDVNARPTETEEQYLTRVVDEVMWQKVCNEIVINGDKLDKNQFKSALNNNAPLKGMVIQLAIHKKCNESFYKVYPSTQGVEQALIVILDKLK